MRITIPILLLAIALIACNADKPIQTSVNMDKVAQIESSGNVRAYNKRSGATGLYQITQICLTEYNTYNQTRYNHPQDMLDPALNKKVALWYMNKRIPQLLRYYDKADTVTNRLIAYNCGISCVVKGRIPKETKNYLRKYYE